MYLIMHLFYTARDTTSHALGTIASAMGPCGALGALGMGVITYLLLRLFTKIMRQVKLLLVMKL